ncbi:type I-E CRISPR-associated protein Cse1/CasA [Streptomyces sp. NPDC017979]|uniref:type I-E CRISPR-associated protein Cse1/CasA n=1 Tax=Streptomyces sp. NPDC017979 TaxID=3365024 RepID=UPI003799CEEC
MDLIDQPWLRVHRLRPPAGTGGSLDPAPVLSLRQLLLKAHELRDLVVELPTQKPAILRQVVLPVVVDALGFPADAAEWSAHVRAAGFGGERAEKLNEYLDANRHRFDLFHPVDPFAQVAGARTDRDETKSSALLVTTAAAGNNVPIFAARTEGDRLALTPAEAARWLLHAHCWDTGAIKTGVVGDPRAKQGKTMGNPTGSLGQLGIVVPRGETLYETLMLNVPYGRTRLADDRPQWRRRGPQDAYPSGTPEWGERAARGVLDAWTWQSRRIRLVPEETDEGVRVARVVVAAGDRLTVLAEHETHTAWRIESPERRAKRTAPKTGAGASDAGARREPPPQRPVRHAPGRAAWRGFNALLAVGRVGEETLVTATTDGFSTSELLRNIGAAHHELGDRFRLRLELTGLAYGQKLGNVEDVCHDEVPLPVAALDPHGPAHGGLLGAVDQAEALAKAVNRLADDLRRSVGAAAPPPRGSWQEPGEALLHALDPSVRRLLVELREAGDDVGWCDRLLGDWEVRAGADAWRTAEQLLVQPAPGAFHGRKVTQGGVSRRYRLSQAEKAFRYAVDDVLPRRTARREEKAAERRAVERRAAARKAEQTPPKEEGDH